MDCVYRIDAAAVVSDIIDGEAVMLHRISGDYFSTDGVGCLIWQWIGDDLSRNQIISKLNARFATGPGEIATAVDQFLADLLTHKLVRKIDEVAKHAPELSIEPQTNPDNEFLRPVLMVYSDIREVMLLDPIHDLTEEGTWPERKQTDKQN